MSRHDLPLAQKLYPAGCRVRFLRGARDKVPSLGREHDGLLLKTIEMPDQSLKLMVEYATADGAWDHHTFDPRDVDIQPYDISRRRRDLIGRRVHFPRSSGIGIAFPKGASDYGEIIAIDLDDDGLWFILRIDVAGEKRPFVTWADFSRCDLLPRMQAKKSPDP